MKQLLEKFKLELRRTRTGFFGALIGTAILTVGLWVPPAEAIAPYTYNVPLYVTTITNGGTAATGTNYIYTNNTATGVVIEQGVGGLLSASVTATGNGTSNFWLGLDFQVDTAGDYTYLTNAVPLNLTNVLCGSNVTAIVTWQLTASQLSNYIAFRVDEYGTTQTNPVTLNWVRFTVFK